MRWQEFIVYAHHVRDTGGDLHGHGYSNVGEHEPQPGTTGDRAVGPSRIPGWRFPKQVNAGRPYNSFDHREFLYDRIW